MDPHNIARSIEHTLLRPDADLERIAKICSEASSYGFRSVCVNPVHVAHCSLLLQGSGVGVCAVVGFPLGASKTVVKAIEAEQAIGDGAREVDMVMNVGWLKSGCRQDVLSDVRQVAYMAHGSGALIKVIIETALLNDDEKRLACTICLEAGADFVKTSTGFLAGATPDDVRLIREAVGGRAGIKASGGIKDYAAVLAMIAAGADRIGTSHGVAIMAEADLAAGRS